VHKIHPSRRELLGGLAAAALAACVPSVGAADKPSGARPRSDSHLQRREKTPWPVDSRFLGAVSDGPLRPSRVAFAAPAPLRFRQEVSAGWGHAIRQTSKAYFARSLSRSNVADAYRKLTW